MSQGMPQEEFDHYRFVEVKEFFNKNLVWDEDTKQFINSLMFVQDKSLQSIIRAVSTIDSNIDIFYENTLKKYVEYADNLRYEYIYNIIDPLNHRYAKETKSDKYNVWLLKDRNRFFINFIIEVTLTELRAQYKIISDNIKIIIKNLEKIRGGSDCKDVYDIDGYKEQLAINRKLKKFCKVLLYPFDKGTLSIDDIDLDYFLEGGKTKG